MKKLIVLSIIMAVVLLVAALAQAQAPANNLKPTFINPTPDARSLRQRVACLHRILPQRMGGSTLHRASECFYGCGGPSRFIPLTRTRDWCLSSPAPLGGVGQDKVPADIRVFLDMYCVDTLSHDVKTIIAHYSDRFRHSGGSKAAYEQWFRNDPASPIQRDVTSCEATVTVFEPRGDKAYVDGFISEKAKGDPNALKEPMMFQQIINEHGEWKWFGNQK